AHMSFSSAPRPEEPMQPDQPTPDQLASFDQTFAELGANLDALLDTFGAMVTDGEQPDLATAGMAQWLFVNHDAATLGEHLAAAVRRLHDRERAAYERGLAEGRRQATEGWEREHLWGVVLDHGDEPQYKCGSEEDARSFALTRPGSRVVRQTTARLVGPWEPAEQPEPVKILSYHYGPEPAAVPSCASHRLTAATTRAPTGPRPVVWSSRCAPAPASTSPERPAPTRERTTTCPAGSTRTARSTPSRAH